MARHGGEADRATAGLGRVVGPQVPGHTPSRSLVRPSPGLCTASVATALAIAACRSGNATTPVTSQATTETSVVGTAPTEETTATSTTPTTTETAQAETTSEPAPAIEQFARDNFYRRTVVGVGTLEIAQEFVVSKGTAFATLWSESRDAWAYYGMDSTSDFMRLDPFGNRLTEPVPFDEHLEQLLDVLV